MVPLLLLPLLFVLPYPTSVFYSRHFLFLIIPFPSLPFLSHSHHHSSPYHHLPLFLPLSSCYSAHTLIICHLSLFPSIPSAAHHHYHAPYIFLLHHPLRPPVNPHFCHYNHCPLSHFAPPLHHPSFPFHYSPLSIAVTLYPFLSSLPTSCFLPFLRPHHHHQHKPSLSSSSVVSLSSAGRRTAELHQGKGARVAVRGSLCR